MAGDEICNLIVNLARRRRHGRAQALVGIIHGETKRRLGETIDVNTRGPSPGR